MTTEEGDDPIGEEAQLMIDAMGPKAAALVKRGLVRLAAATRAHATLAAECAVHDGASYEDFCELASDLYFAVKRAHDKGDCCKGN